MKLSVRDIPIIEDTWRRIQPGDGTARGQFKKKRVIDLLGVGGWIFGLVKLGIIFQKRSKDTFQDLTTRFRKT